jgi:heavy metal sensor kinase
VFSRSIRLTLTLWNALTLAVILVLFSILVYTTLSKHLYAEYDRELEHLAESLANPTLEPFWSTPQSAFDQVLEDFIGQKAAGRYVQITLPSGQPGARTLNMGETVFPLDDSQRARAGRGKTAFVTLGKGVDGLPLRVLIYPVISNDKLAGIIQLGVPLTDAMATLENLQLVFAIAIPLILIVIGFGSWMLTFKALKPVELLTQTARRISAENLSERIIIVNPDDEIGKLAATMNEMLARLEGSFSRMRRFCTDVSHELRTPLTIIRGEMEVGARWGRDLEECRTIMGSSLEEINRMTGIIEDLLEMSRIDDGQMILELREMDLAPLVGRVMKHKKLQPSAARVIIDGGSEPVPVRGDDRLLRMVFVALTDNALRYSPAEEMVTIRISKEGGRASVAVCDRGPGLAPEEAQRIFEPFYRIDEARNRSQGGVGLGLPLVRSIVEAHGGTVELVTAPGQGATFTVLLPLYINPAGDR